MRYIKSAIPRLFYPFRCMSESGEDNPRVQIVDAGGREIALELNQEIEIEELA